MHKVENECAKVCNSSSKRTKCGENDRRGVSYSFLGAAHPLRVRMCEGAQVCTFASAQVRT